MKVKYTLSSHAKKEIVNRQIPLEFIEEVLSNPQLVYFDEYGVSVYQSILEFPNGKKYLLRIFVANKKPKHIITIYRTSKISKYWRQ